MTTYLMSTTILTDMGIWEARRVSASEAYYVLVRGGAPNFTSAVGHEATARIIEQLLEPPMAGYPTLTIQAARLTVSAQVGDVFVCFKLKQRPPEGAILGLNELRALAHEWVIMTLLAQDVATFKTEIVAGEQAATELMARQAEQCAERQAAAERQDAADRAWGRRSRPALETPRSFMGGHRD